MAQLGKVNQLSVSRISPYSTFLDGGDLGEVMLLKDSAVSGLEVGDSLSVFVYLDSDETLVGSTRLPSLVEGECGCLTVVAKTDNGVFLDWGLKSDLFLPRSEQMGDSSVGSQCVVVVLLDENNSRMIASSRLYKYLPEVTDGECEALQKVELIISQRTDIGYRAVVNRSHLGMLYHDEIFNTLKVGDVHSGFIKSIREDGKIDLILQRPSNEARSDLESKILDHLKQNNGASHLTDKSPPPEIYQTFGVSKKAYKKAIGALYKNRLITLSKEQIELAE